MKIIGISIKDDDFFVSNSEKKMKPVNSIVPKESTEIKCSISIDMIEKGKNIIININQVLNIISVILESNIDRYLIGVKNKIIPINPINPIMYSIVI